MMDCVAYNLFQVGVRMRRMQYMWVTILFLCESKSHTSSLDGNIAKDVD